MADSLAGDRRRGSRTPQEQNRRFVADVAHELRTPLTALVAEASRASRARCRRCRPTAAAPRELLVADVRRLRDLVDDLHGDLALRRRRRAARASSRWTSAASSPRSSPRGYPAAAVILPGEARRRRVGPAAARPDPRQPPRQRPRRTPRAPPSRSRVTPVAGGAVVTVADRGPGVPAEAPRPPVRPLLQGGPVARRARRARASASRSRPSTRRCSAAASARATGRAAASSSRSRSP